MCDGKNDRFRDGWCWHSMQNTCCIPESDRTITPVGTRSPQLVHSGRGKSALLGSACIDTAFIVTFLSTRTPYSLAS